MNTIGILNGTRIRYKSSSPTLKIFGILACVSFQSENKLPNGVNYSKQQAITNGVRADVDLTKSVRNN